MPPNLSKQDESKKDELDQPGVLWPEHTRPEAVPSRATHEFIPKVKFAELLKGSKDLASEKAALAADNVRLSAELTARTRLTGPSSSLSVFADAVVLIRAFPSEIAVTAAGLDRSKAVQYFVHKRQVYEHAPALAQDYTDAAVSAEATGSSAGASQVLTLDLFHNDARAALGVWVGWAYTGKLYCLEEGNGEGEAEKELLRSCVSLGRRIGDKGFVDAVGLASKHDE